MILSRALGARETFRSDLSVCIFSESESNRRIFKQQLQRKRYQDEWINASIRAINARIRASIRARSARIRASIKSEKCQNQSQYQSQKCQNQSQYQVPEVPVSKQRPEYLEKKTFLFSVEATSSKQPSDFPCGCNAIFCDSIAFEGSCAASKYPTPCILL